MLIDCIDVLSQMAETPELAGDRLVWSSLPEAYETLGSVYAQLGRDDQANQAGKTAAEIRKRAPEGPRNVWQL